MRETKWEGIIMDYRIEENFVIFWRSQCSFHCKWNCFQKYQSKITHFECNISILKHPKMNTLESWQCLTMQSNIGIEHHRGIDLLPNLYIAITSTGVSINLYCEKSKWLFLLLQDWWLRTNRMCDFSTSNRIVMISDTHTRKMILQKWDLKLWKLLTLHNYSFGLNTLPEKIMMLIGAFASAEKCKDEQTESHRWRVWNV